MAAHRISTEGWRLGDVSGRPLMSPPSQDAKKKLNVN